MNHKRWTTEETEFLRANYLTVPTWQLKETLTRFASKAIWERASRLKLGPKRENHKPGAGFGAPPEKRDALRALLVAAGSAGLSAEELAAANPGTTANALKMRIYLARENGDCYSIGVRYGMRHFHPDVPREAADVTMAVYQARAAAQSKALAAARRISYREMEYQSKRESRAVRRVETEAIKAAAASARRADRDRVAKDLAEQRAAAKEAAVAAKPKRRAKPIPVKVEKVWKAGTLVAKSPAPTGPARRPGDMDLSRAKLTIAPPPPDRWAVKAPAAGGFAHLRPGQYELEPTSCAARAAA